MKGELVVADDLAPELAQGLFARGARYEALVRLAGGFLKGKNGRDDKREGCERLNGGDLLGSSKFSDRNWAILDALKAVAAELDCPPARVGLAWTITQPCIDALLLGASRPEQVHEDIAALTLGLSSARWSTLDAAGALEPAFPDGCFSDEVKRSVLGGRDVATWPKDAGR